MSNKKKINGNKVTSIGRGKPPRNCEHDNITVDANLVDVTEKVDGPVVGKCLTISLSCNDCGTPFAFKDLPVAKSHLVPSMTTTGLEGRFPVSPSSGERRVDVEELGGQDDTVRFTVERDK